MYSNITTLSSSETVTLNLKEKHISSNEFRRANGGVLEYKETDLGDLIVKGYIATTHIDAVKDSISKSTLDKWAKEINEGIPRANKATYHHDRSDPRVVGVGIKGTAKVDLFPDGQYGLYVDTIVNKSHDLFDSIKYEYKIGALDSFSIEYLYSGEGKEGSGRVLDSDNTELYGWTLSSRPVNEYAVMIKELLSKNTHSSSLSSSSKGLEENNMAENETQKKVSEAELKELQELKEFKKKMEDDNKKKLAEEEEEKKKKEDATKMASMKKEIVSDILESKEFSAKLDAEASKIKMETKEQEKLSVEFKEFTASMSDKELAPSAKLLSAVNYALKEGLLDKGTGYVESRLDSNGFNHVQANGTKLQVKSYGLGDNLAGASSATALAAHRHADLVEALDAGIFNLLNDNVSAYDTLPKTSAVGSGSDHASFVVRTGRNPTAGAYTGNEVSTGKSNKQKYSTKFKKYKAGFAVDGDLIAANRGAPQGSALASEIEFATYDLKKEINTDLYTEQGLESAAKIIGFEYIADGAGNTSLYGETRSSANGLKAGTVADTYVDGSTGSLKDHLRTLIRKIKVDGGNKKGIKIFMNDLQLQRLKGEEDNALRYEPGASNIGFAPSLTFEGYGIVEDVDCPEAKVFVEDTSSVELRFWVTPTTEMLGKRSDSSEGFIKTYLAAIYKAPRRVTMIHSLPTA